MNLDDFNSHGLWQELSETRSLILDGELIADVSTEMHAKRILIIVEFALAHKDSFSDLWTLNDLNSVSASFKNIFSNLQNYLQQNNLNFLDRAVADAEVVLASIRAWPTTQTTLDAGIELIEAYKNLSQQWEAACENQKMKTKELDVFISNLQELANNLNSKLDEQLESNTKYFSALETKQESMNQSIGSTIEDFKKELDNKISAHSIQFDKWLIEQEKQFSTRAQPHVAAIEDILISAKSNLVEIEKLHNSTKNLAELTTGDILAGKYAETAASDRFWAVSSYVVALIIFGSGLYGVIFAFGALEKVGGQWTAVSLKIALASILVAATSVPIRVGSRFLNQYSQFKKTELELRALEPLMANMNEEQRGTIKKDFIERAFAGRDGIRHSLPTSEEGLKNLLSQALEMLLRRKVS